MTAPSTRAAAAVSSAIGDLERDGTLDRDAGKNLDDKVRDVEKELREGNAEAVVDAADAVAEELRGGVEDGDISADAAAVLDPLVADLVEAARGFRG